MSIYNLCLKFWSSASTSAEPEEGEIMLDETLMSPAAKILKLGAEHVVSNIQNYLLHHLGREIKPVS